MAENLKSCLEYNLEQIFMKQELDSDAEESDDSSISEQYQRPPQRQSARNANTRLEKLEDKVYARLRGLSSSESSIIESHHSSEMMSDEEDNSEVDKENQKSSDDQDEVLDEYEGVDDDIKDEPVDKDNDLKVSSPNVSNHQSSDNNDNKTYDVCSPKSCTTEESQSDDQKDVQTSDGGDAKSSPHSPSIEDEPKDTSAIIQGGVIAFAPGVSSQDLSQHIDDEETLQLKCKSDKQESVQCHQQTASLNTNESERKELHGQYLNTQGLGTKVNRVKPIQNVSPYVPDIHSDQTNNKRPSASHDHFQPAQPISQGLQPMIDLNLNRPDVFKPLKSSTNVTPKNTEMPCDKQNSISVNLGLNQVVPQGNLYRPSSLNENSDIDHSKQSSHSGSNIIHKRNKSMDLPELPAPLTVLPVQRAHQESSLQHVPAVQPLMPSSNYTLQASHQERAESIRVNTFHPSQLAAESKAHILSESNVCDSSQKLWRPLGSDNRITPNYARTNQSIPHHTTTKSDQLYSDHKKLPQPGYTQSSQVHSPSGNILESLLHKQSRVAEYQQSNATCNNPKMLASTSKMYTANTKGDDISNQELHFPSKHAGHLKLSSDENIQYHEAPGQCQSNKQQPNYRSQQHAYSKHTPSSQTESNTYISPINTHSQQGSVKLHHKPVESFTTNPSQLVARQPENSMQEMETFISKQQQISSTPLYPQTSSIQSAAVNQIGHGNVSQVHSNYMDRARNVDTMVPSRNSASYLSMLSTESRNMKEYIDRERFMQNQAQSLNLTDLNGGVLGMQGYNKGHSTLYTDHLRMHASQASSYGYPSASHLLLPSRQMTGNPSSSAFTPHDPYSSQSAFRMQRPSHSMYPQYMQEAEQLARQQYQHHMHHRAGLGAAGLGAAGLGTAGLGAAGLYQAPRPTHTHPDMAYYTQVTYKMNYHTSIFSKQ